MKEAEAREFDVPQYCAVIPQRFSARNLLFPAFNLDEVCGLGGSGSYGKKGLGNPVRGYWNPSWALALALVPQRPAARNLQFVLSGSPWSFNRIVIALA
jgi:hypothetical protein